MNIKINTETKTVIIYEPISLGELKKYLKNTLVNWKEYSIVSEYSYYQWNPPGITWFDSSGTIQTIDCQSTDCQSTDSTTFTHKNNAPFTLTTN